MRWKKRAAAALALVMVMSGLTGPHPAGGAGPTGDRQWDGKTHSVTLITGDRVMVTSLANGTHRVTYAPGPGREHVGFLKRAGKDRIDIIPSDALRPLSAGKLDPRLFEVLGLIRHGYDDRSGADIPLIAQGGSRAAVSGATVVRPWCEHCRASTRWRSTRASEAPQPSTAQGGFSGQLHGGRGQRSHARVFERRRPDLAGGDSRQSR